MSCCPKHYEYQYHLPRTCEGAKYIHPGCQFKFNDKGLDLNKGNKNQIQSNNEKQEQEHIMQSGHIGIPHETLTPTVIIPVKTDKNNSYRIRTLLDSGSSANWITKDVLKYIKFESLGTYKVKVHHFGGVNTQKYQVVRIYIDPRESLFKHKVDTKYKDQISIDCFVSNEFTFHRSVPGIVDHIRENYTLSNYILSKIIEPDALDISHADINEGTALILSNASKIKIMGRDSRNIRLERINLLLEQTIFGYSISGKVPDKLMPKTHNIENNKVVPVLAHDRNISTCVPCDEYFPGCRAGLPSSYVLNKEL